MALHWLRLVYPYSSLSMLFLSFFTSRSLPYKSASPFVKTWILMALTCQPQLKIVGGWRHNEGSFQRNFYRLSILWSAGWFSSIFQLTSYRPNGASMLATAHFNLQDTRIVSREQTYVTTIQPYISSTICAQHTVNYIGTSSHRILCWLLWNLEQSVQLSCSSNAIKLNAMCKNNSISENADTIKIVSPNPCCHGFFDPTQLIVI